MRNAFLYLVPVKGGKVSFVDRDTWHAAQGWSWSLAGHGYAHRSHGVYLHRVAVHAPDGSEVDHLNHNILDNRRCNLRVCLSRSLNHLNRRPYSQRPLPQGVSRKGKRFRARIMLNKHEQWLGVFDTAELATAAYECAKRKLQKELTHGA